MSDTVALRRKIAGAADLQGVVRTMKAMAAANLGQFEASVVALTDYYRTVELGLSVCLKHGALELDVRPRKAAFAIGAIVFGSDQGLVGQFNEDLVDFALASLKTLGGQPKIWAIGERVGEQLQAGGLTPIRVLTVPSTVSEIAPLVTTVLLDSERHRLEDGYTDVYLFHNRPHGGTRYEASRERILPLDNAWQAALVSIDWPTSRAPDVLSGIAPTLRALVREYLFIALFRACAESLASENASRLAAMERADKSIDELLTDLNGRFHRLRQAGIDDELFDLVSGFEALS